jgi:biopolymer transport protein ExbD
MKISPLRLITVGIMVFLLGLMVLYGSALADSPQSYEYALHGMPEWLFLIGFWGMAFCGTGIWFFLRGVHVGLGGRVRKRSLPRIFPGTKLRNLTAWKSGKASQTLVTVSLNAFSVSWICVLMTLLTTFMIMTPRPPTGLNVDWKKPSHISATESPWPETMSVYIAPLEKFLVNGKAIRRQELEAKLREELGRRAEWTVYVEADKETQFSDTVYAIDTIQGLGGKVVWITPKMRTTKCKVIETWSDPSSSHGFQQVCDQSGWR